MNPRLSTADTTHAISRMQERGYTPTVVENVIKNGVSRVGNESSATVYTDNVNNISAVVDSTSGRVITVRGGI